MASGNRAVESDQVWTTLITNEAYIPGLLTLHYSLLKSGTRYPLVALYTDTLPPQSLAALHRRNIPTQKINQLLPKLGPKYENDTRFLDCWTKLTPFSMTEYKRIVQLDSDMLVLKNMDELMELELDDPEIAADVTDGNEAPAGVESKKVFAGGHACICNPLKKPHYPSDWTPSNCAFTAQHSTPDEAQTSGGSCTASPLGYMNGGLQVVNPSKRIFRQIATYMEENAASMDFADQSVLSGLFRGRWVALPYIYNALKTLRWKGVHDEIWRDGEVKNIHYILAPKPWNEVGEGGKWTGTEGSHLWWFDMDTERKRKEQVEGIDDEFSK